METEDAGEAVFQFDYYLSHTCNNGERRGGNKYHPFFFKKKLGPKWLDREKGSSSVCLGK